MVRFALILAGLACLFTTPAQAKFCWPHEIMQQINGCGVEAPPSPPREVKAPNAKKLGAYYDLEKPETAARMIAGSGESDINVVALADALRHEADRNGGREQLLKAYESIASGIFARVERDDDEDYDGEVWRVVYAYRPCTIKAGRQVCDVDFKYGRNPPGITRKDVAWYPVAQFSYVHEGHDLPWVSNRKDWEELTLPIARKLYANWKAGHTPKVEAFAQQRAYKCRFYFATWMKKPPRWKNNMYYCGTVAKHHFYDPSPVKALALTAQATEIKAPKHVQPAPQGLVAIAAWETWRGQPKPKKGLWPWPTELPQVAELQESRIPVFAFPEAQPATSALQLVSLD